MNNTTELVPTTMVSDMTTLNDTFGSENGTGVEVLHEPADHVEAIIVPVLFAIIFLVGVIGNTALIYTVLRNKSMRNTPNIFVVSLSFGDLMLLLFSVPFSSTFYTLTSWPFGNGICKLNEFMQTFSVGVSVFTLTALSGDRFIAIVHPMSKHTGKPTLITVGTVIGIWILSLVLAIPDAVTSREFFYNIDNTSAIAVCVIYPPDMEFQWYSQVHSMAKFCIFFAIPLIIIAIFYALMAQILILSSRDMPCEAVKDSVMNQQQKRQVQARLKVAKVVLSFVVIFVICWLPRHISILLFYFSDIEFNLTLHVLKITSFCLSYIYACVNPYALYFLSSQFRKYYNRYLFCCCPNLEYGRLSTEQSNMYHFNSTVRSTTYTGVAQSQSMC